MSAARAYGSERAQEGPRVHPGQQFYFLHGDAEAAIERFKSQIVSAHLTGDQRPENYREVTAANQPGSLQRVVAEVMSELATVSFLPGIKRVVTLYGATDFFEGKGAKSAKGGKAAKSAKEPAKTASKAKAPAAPAAPQLSASDRLAAFISRELPDVPGILIVVALEDYEKWRRIAPANPVVHLAQQTGALYGFREQGPQFAFFDALLARDAGRALELWRAWWEHADGAPKLLWALASHVRLLIEAKTATMPAIAARGITRQRLAADLFPPEAERNLYRLQPEFRREKIERAATRFTLNELLGAFRRLEPLLKYAIPLSTDPYVPDRKLMAEIWVLDFATPAAGRQS